jgi:hypothetical protein
VCAFFRRQRCILVGVNTIFSGDVRLHIGRQCKESGEKKLFQHGEYGVINVVILYVQLQIYQFDFIWAKKNRPKFIGLTNLGHRLYFAIESPFIPQ